MIAKFKDFFTLIERTGQPIGKSQKDKAPVLKASMFRLQERRMFLTMRGRLWMLPISIVVVEFEWWLVVLPKDRRWRRDDLSRAVAAVRPGTSPYSRLASLRGRPLI